MLNNQTLLLLCDPHMWTLTTKKLGQQRIYIYTIYIYIHNHTHITYVYIYIHTLLCHNIVYSVPICYTFNLTKKKSFPQRAPGAIILDVADRQIRDPGEVVLQTSGFEAVGERPTMGNGIRN